MKIRIMGTRAECEYVSNYYRQLSESPEIKYIIVSGLYPNRGSSNIFRVNVEVEYLNTSLIENKH